MNEICNTALTKNIWITITLYKVMYIKPLFNLHYLNIYYIYIN